MWVVGLRASVFHQPLIGVCRMALDMWLFSSSKHVGQEDDRGLLAR